MMTITNKLTLDDLLIQAAEEASELAQALTKYYRVTHGSNPTPVTLDAARNALIEEIADVNVAVNALDMKTPPKQQCYENEDRYGVSVALDIMLVKAANASSEMARATTKYCLVQQDVFSTYGERLKYHQEMWQTIHDMEAEMEVLRRALGISCDDIAEIEAEKIARWEERVKNGI